MASNAFDRLFCECVMDSCKRLNDQEKKEKIWDDWKTNLLNELKEASCHEDMADLAMMILRDLLAFKSDFDFNFFVTNQMREYLEILQEIL